MLVSYNGSFTTGKGLQHPVRNLNTIKTGYYNTKPNIIVQTAIKIIVVYNIFFLLYLSTKYPHGRSVISRPKNIAAPNTPDYYPD
jgi:hypothetical protein